MSDDKKLHDQTNSSADANPDPITGQPGAHPVGTGIGAAGAGAVGAALGGLAGGPIGAAVGTVIGAVAGGLAGKSAAERVNPTVEDEYWRNNYTARPYVEKDRSYQDYQPAYRMGYEGYRQYGDLGKTYAEVEPDLRSEYEKQQGGARLPWDTAKHATKDAWERLDVDTAGNPLMDDQSLDPTVTRPDQELRS